MKSGKEQKGGKIKMWTIIYMSIVVFFFIASCITSGKIIKRDYANYAPDMYFLAIPIAIFLSIFWPLTLIIIIAIKLMGYEDKS
jgi:hypothetical protein